MIYTTIGKAECYDWQPMLLFGLALRTSSFGTQPEQLLPSIRFQRISSDEVRAFFYIPSVFRVPD